MLHAVKRRKANWIGHIWRGNCLLKHDIAFCTAHYTHTHTHTPIRTG